MTQREMKMKFLLLALTFVAVVSGATMPQKAINELKKKHYHDDDLDDSTGSDSSDYSSEDSDSSDYSSEDSDSSDYSSEDSDSSDYSSEGSDSSDYSSEDLDSSDYSSEASDSSDYSSEESEEYGDEHQSPKCAVDLMLKVRKYCQLDDYPDEVRHYLDTFNKIILGETQDINIHDHLNAIADFCQGGGVSYIMCLEGLFDLGNQPTQDVESCAAEIDLPFYDIVNTLKYSFEAHRWLCKIVNN